MSLSDDKLENVVGGSMLPMEKVMTAQCNTHHIPCTTVSAGWYCPMCKRVLNASEYTLGRNNNAY